MTISTELRRVFLKFRADEGIDAANDLVAAHGGENSIDSVPAENLPALARELGIDDERPGGRSIAFGTPRVRKSLDEIREDAWDRFNHPPKRRSNPHEAE